MVLRFAHIIKDNKATSYPQRFIFFDTETKEHKIDKDTTEHKLKLGVACYCRFRKAQEKPTLQYKIFYTPKAFWEFVESKHHAKSKLYLIAHNIAFDIKIVKGFYHLKRQGYKLQKFIDNVSTNIWDFKKGDKRLVCLDNMNYFKVSLANLGKSIGLEKMVMPLLKQDKSVWLKYCERDVNIMVEAWRLWRAFIFKNNLGSFAKTLASQSLNAFRHRFMTKDIYIHNSKDVTELERISYHGGRVECFYIGKLPKEKYYNLDVNSMYPSVMLKNEYPVKYLYHIVRPPVAFLKGVLKTKCVIAKVKLRTKENIFPYVLENKLVFPIGEFITTLTTRELQYALAKNYIKEVLEMAVYKKAIIFDKYVKFFYNSRLKFTKQHNYSFAYLSKLLLNSLYGKFGQRNEIYEVTNERSKLGDGYYEEWNYQTSKIEKYRVIAGVEETFVGHQEGFNSFPAIPSHVTADARLLLDKFLKIAGYSNVFYCDTDSVITNHKGYNKLSKYIRTAEIGYFSLRATANRVIIKGLKDYIFGKDVKIKGIRHNAELLSANLYRQVKFEGLRGALRKGRADKMIIMNITKRVKRNYTKGIVTKSGWVKPYDVTAFERNKDISTFR